ncbi:hypothetical protein Dsin_031840 [Dipteronia sinensis]|uniref:Uncharacterized protein n=1 Tax=Dipteronia sinensis TaxID=43782 RepID=A0AAD9ZNM8_9ROSI|nr:hypothetical protein Dsin_031840 [Dipteronia sinensis]
MAEAISVSLNDSSDVIDFVTSQGYGVKDLLDMGLKILPEQYIQPLEERLMTEVGPKNRFLSSTYRSGTTLKWPIQSVMQLRSGDSSRLSTMECLFKC